MRPRERSHYEDLRRSVLDKLQSAKVDTDIVTMPDFLLDHSVECPFDTRILTRRMLSVASRGGGEISNVRQSLEVGGNAAICTLALARLGATVHPIMKTDALGLSLIRHFYENAGVDLRRVKLTGSVSPTTILELRTRNVSTNIMFGDSSSIPPFSFEDLDAEDLAAIDDAAYICVFNWLYNSKGTDLAEKVFRYCRRNSRGRTFFDAADPTPRIKELPDLNKRVLRNGLIDMWGLNENEARCFAKLYKPRFVGSVGNSPLEAGKVISANTGAEVLLHTAQYSASISGDQAVLVPAFAVPARRGTGAGDSWNAGIMAADALGLKEEERLFFANAVAGRYVSSSQRVYSTIGEMVEFLTNSALRLRRVKFLSDLSTI